MHFQCFIMLPNKAFEVNHIVFQKLNLDQVSLWLPYLHELQPAVQILVCEECTDDDGSVAS